MKNIIKSTLMLGAVAFALTACDKDLDSNPTLQTPETFTINTPGVAGNLLDLNNSTIVVTGAQPDYGFPVSAQYEVEYSANEDMSGAQLCSTRAFTPRIEVIGNEIAVGLTNYFLENGKTEDDFPMTVPVYLRAKATVAGETINSNVVCLKQCYLPFSLPAVKAPEHLYITGQFCGWSWDKTQCIDMNMVHGTDNVFWSLVYFEGGIKFNSAMDWDGGEQGYNNVRSISGDKADDIVDDGGNFGAKNQGWYLMIVTCEVVGRDVVFDVQFNAPNVWLMGTITPNAGWSELEDGCLFDVPAEKDANFVSPAFSHDVSGDGGARCYVKVPGYDWWKSEFVPLNGKIVYRGTGDDQERVDGKEGQRFYLNFYTGEGYIK